MEYGIRQGLIKEDQCEAAQNFAGLFCHSVQNGTKLSKQMLEQDHLDLIYGMH